MFGARNPEALPFHCPRVSPGDQPLTKEPEDYGIEIVVFLFAIPQVIPIWQTLNFPIYYPYTLKVRTCMSLKIPFHLEFVKYIFYQEELTVIFFGYF